MPNNKANIVADYEQIEQAAIETAKVIHSYYEQLVKSGVDHEFARELTRDFASSWWDTMMNVRNNWKSK